MLIMDTAGRIAYEMPRGSGNLSTESFNMPSLNALATSD